jgi:arginase
MKHLLQKYSWYATCCCYGDGRRPIDRSRGREPKLAPEHLVYIALRDVDEGEIREISRLGIKVITMEEVRTRGVDIIMNEALVYLRERVDRFYISFDMDSLDASLVPGTGTPVDGGLTAEEGKAILEEAMQANDLIAVELVEFES